METETKQRSVFYLESHERLSKKELGEAFAVNDQHPMWIAINQLLHDYIRDAIDKSRNPGLANHLGSLASVSAELDAFCTLYEDLHQLRSDALAPASDSKKSGVRVMSHVEK